MEEQRFESKVDTWYFVVMAGVLLLSGFIAVPAMLAGKWWTGIFLGAGPALLIWNWRSTSYVVSSDTLAVRCLLLRKKIPLATVTALRASRDLRSSPALSLDRIEVLSSGASVLVSPKDKAAFIRAIRRAQPAVIVEGLLETA